MAKYYSIRVVNADSQEEADEKVRNNQFDESDPLCDTVMTSDGIREEFFVKK